MRTRIAVLLVSVLTLFLSAFAVAPAQAGQGGGKPGPVTTTTTVSCGQYTWIGDRLCYLTEADGGGVLWSIMHIRTVNGHDQAFGQAFAAEGSSIYFDVSTNGGASWVGFVGQVNNTTSTWQWIYTPNGGIYDGPGYWIRVCATHWDGYFTCTPWN